MFGHSRPNNLNLLGPEWPNNKEGERKGDREKERERE